MTKFKVKYIRTAKTVRQSGSLQIGLPKKFCRDNEITKGTPIEIYTNDDGDILILRKHKLGIGE